MKIICVLILFLSPIFVNAQNKLMNLNQTKVYKKEGTYVGAFVNGLRDGKGVMTYDDNTEYKGAWKNDKRDGAGIFTFNENVTFVGLFANNVGKGSKRYNDGIDIKGTLSADYVFTEDLIAFGNLKAKLKNSVGMINKLGYTSNQNRIIRTGLDLSFFVIESKFIVLALDSYSEWADDINVSMEMYDRRTFGYKLRKKYTDPQNNFVVYEVLFIISSNFSSVPFNNPSLEIAENLPSDYLKVFTISRNGLDVINGEIQSEQCVNFSSNLIPNLGSPIFNRNGKVIGIIAKQINTNNCQTYHCFMVELRSEILTAIAN